ncbi:MAG: outer membrane lipoprotein-sorting protein [Nitrospirota bacterium]|nr:outer membrane lipoprotein-sorting protein [Nitrospirota bacterium]
MHHPSRIPAATRAVALALLAAIAFAPAPASAETPEEQGLRLAREADQRDTGWGDATSTLTMILTNRHGESSTRQVHNQNMEVKGDGDKALIVFDSPADVKGTALLSFAHLTGSDDQWLYLPALKRVKRISSGNKSGSFMGSEFAYEDISGDEPEKYTHRYLRDEALDGQPCHVVERDPVDPNSGYSRQIVWWDVEHLRVQKVEYYDRKGSLLKTLTFHDYRQYLDRFWRAHEYRMVNHQTGKGTVLKWTDYKFHNGLTDADFTQAALQRAR